jgi:hypothetical protein
VPLTQASLHFDDLLASVSQDRRPAASAYPGDFCLKGKEKQDIQEDRRGGPFNDGTKSNAKL